MAQKRLDKLKYRDNSSAASDNEIEKIEDALTKKGVILIDRRKGNTDEA